MLFKFLCNISLIKIKQIGIFGAIIGNIICNIIAFGISFIVLINIFYEKNKKISKKRGILSKIGE